MGGPGTGTRKEGPEHAPAPCLCPSRRCAVECGPFAFVAMRLGGHSACCRTRRAAPPPPPSCARVTTALPKHPRPSFPVVPGSGGLTVGNSGCMHCFGFSSGAESVCHCLLWDGAERFCFWYVRGPSAHRCCCCPMGVPPTPAPGCSRFARSSVKHGTVGGVWGGWGGCLVCVGTGGWVGLSPGPDWVRGMWERLCGGGGGGGCRDGFGVDWAGRGTSFWCALEPLQGLMNLWLRSRQTIPHV